MHVQTHTPKLRDRGLPNPAPRGHGSLLSASVQDHEAPCSPPLGTGHTGAERRPPDGQTGRRSSLDKEALADAWSQEQSPTPAVHSHPRDRLSDAATRATLGTKQVWPTLSTPGYLARLGPVTLPFSLKSMTGQTRGRTPLIVCLCRRDRNGHCSRKARNEQGMTGLASFEGPGQAEGLRLPSEARLVHEMGDQDSPSVPSRATAVLGWGGCGDMPHLGSELGREGRGSLGPQASAHQVHPAPSTAHQVYPGPLHAPTLHHQPSFAHGAAHVVLGDAKVVSSILWAGTENLQLSAGQDLGTGSWIGWGKWKGPVGGATEPQGGQESST